MAKLTISRIFESSKTLATKTGQEIREFVQYTCDVAEQTLRALRNGLTFQDNLKCLLKTASVTHNIPLAIDIENKSPYGILIFKITADSTANAGYTGFAWYLNSAGQLVITLSVLGAPTTPVTVSLAVLYL
jgi:hypothetical protein